MDKYYNIGLVSLALLLVILFFNYSTESFAQDIEELPSLKSDLLSSFNVVAVGDWGCGEETKNTVKNIESLSPEITLALGDFSYQSTAACWLNLVKPIEKTLKIVKGNHDLDAPDLWNQYISGLSGKVESTKTNQLVSSSEGYYYSFNEKGIHFLVMDSEIPLGKDSAQYKYVESDLIRASSNPDIKWIVVSLHRTPYYVQAGDRTSSPDERTVNNANAASNIRQLFHPLFDKYHVDLVLAGHEHNYQRSYPLKFNNANINLPIQTSVAKKNYVSPEGEIYLTIGTGGYSSELFSAFESVHTDIPIPYYIANTNGEINSKGVLDLTFSKDNLFLNGTFHTNDGNIIDQFTISKDLTVGIFTFPK